MLRIRPWHDKGLLQAAINPVRAASAKHAQKRAIPGPRVVTPRADASLLAILMACSLFPKGVLFEGSFH